MAARVAVVGGGWAGLACAVELATAGCAVSVYESAKQLGGRARGVEVHGHALDNGQHLLIGAYRDTLTLLQRIGSRHLLQAAPLVLDTPPALRLALPRLPAPPQGEYPLQMPNPTLCYLRMKYARSLQPVDLYLMKSRCTIVNLLSRQHPHVVFSRKTHA